MRDKIAAAGFGEAAWQRRNESRAARRQTTDEVIARYAAADGAPGREPLTAGQHILHLLLTVFTCGLWAPVWIIRAMQGNKTAR
jgi:hypothetical protein